MFLGPVFVLVSHLTLFFSFITQNCAIYDSFTGDLPILFYAFAFFLFFLLTLLTDGITISEIARKVNIEDGSKECPICQTSYGKRARHCPICKKCHRRFYMHFMWANKCMYENNIVLFIIYFICDIALCSFLILMAFSRISLDNQTIAQWLKGHALLFVSVILCVYIILQSLIYLVQTFQMLIHNTVALRMKHYGPFEFCVLLKKASNPFDMGIVENLKLAFADNTHLSQYQNSPKYQLYIEEIERNWNHSDTA